VTKPKLPLHDNVFQSAMSDLRVARDFFNHYLPASLLEVLDLKTLRLCRGTFVEPELRKSVTDLLYAIDFLSEAIEPGQKPSYESKKKQVPCYIYLLTEHQNTPVHLMPWRVIKYTCSGIDQHVLETSSEVLPIVIPLVFYNGDKPYLEPISVFDLFGPQKALAKRFMFDSFQLVDISKVPDQEIRNHQWSGLLELTMKHIYARDVMPQLQPILEMIKALADAENIESYLLAVLNYVIKTANTEDRKTFFRQAIQSLPQPLEERTMATIADMLREEGYEKGVLLGEQKGIKKGVLLGKLEGKQEGFVLAREEIAKKLLETTDNFEFVAKVTGLAPEEIKKLRTTVH
jgi:predicted transposase/invertase (TIGR01784 family)